MDTNPDSPLATVLLPPLRKSYSSNSFEKPFGPHQPFHVMSGQGPRIGVNMFLPRIQAHDVLEAPRCEVVVDSRRSAFSTKQGSLEGTRREGPLVQFGPAHAERIIDVLT